jgi:hypothetical protein
MIRRRVMITNGAGIDLCFCFEPFFAAAIPLSAD